ncbi:hypothetical protein V8G54_027982 [Vigna mungo]|uniref:Uncharacterized protein n=1 Tax=Vigna mungo TaxID=3915 RepID=A0AAQ3RIX9_VIGMU
MVIGLEANPVTTLVPLSTLFGFTAGGCHAVVGDGDSAFSLPESATGSVSFFGGDSLKISSNSPQSLSLDAASPEYIVSGGATATCTEEDGGCFSLTLDGESHFASM